MSGWSPPGALLLARNVRTLALSAWPVGNFPMAETGFGATLSANERANSLLNRQP